MRLEAGIAWRYLWKKKSHGAVSAIAAVSVVGVAIATAALICVLSVFNGFRMLLTDRSDMILPDIEVTSADGRVIRDADSLAQVVGAIPGVEIASPVMADQALAIFHQREMPIMLRGVVPRDFRRYTLIDSLIVAGTTLPADAIGFDPPAALVSVGVASRLQAYNPGDCIFLFTPRREGRINLANPAASFVTDSVQTFGIFETLQTDYDAATVYVPIEMARDLLQYEAQGSSVAVKVRSGADTRAVEQRIAAKIGAAYTVRDRLRQQQHKFPDGPDRKMGHGSAACLYPRHRIVQYYFYHDDVRARKETSDADASRPRYGARIDRCDFRVGKPVHNPVGYRRGNGARHRALHTAGTLRPVEDAGGCRSYDSAGISGRFHVERPMVGSCADRDSRGAHFVDCRCICA